MDIRTTLMTAALFALTTAASGGNDIKEGAWKITFDKSLRTLTYTCDGRQLLRGVGVEIRDGAGRQLLSKDYPDVKLTRRTVDDEFGRGRAYTYTYSGLAGRDNIEQTVCFYPDCDFILVDAALVAVDGTAKTDYIAPIVTTTSSVFLPEDGTNVIYDMPHDNDNWVGYAARPWNVGGSGTSCEVSAFYDVRSRGGLVVGSIEHGNWKSGITASPSGANRLRSLTVAAGVVGERTNDVHPDRPSLTRHGAIECRRVRSPRYFLGYYDDWRRGLEELGAATERLCPKLPWNKGTIFAWQSWGGMAEHVNYEGAVDVADFFRRQMQPAGFHNENGDVYIVLDSFWDNFSDSQLSDFVARCKSNGQHPGIYHTPFSGSVENQWG